MEHHERLELDGQPNVDQHRVGQATNLLDHADVVHVPLHEMAPEAIAEAHRALEIHPSADRPVTDRRAAERRHDGGDVEPARPRFAHGETGAVYRDALAVLEPRVAAADAQLAPRIGPLHALDDADVVNQSGEHAK